MHRPSCAERYFVRIYTYEKHMLYAHMYNPGTFNQIFRYLPTHMCLGTFTYLGR